MGEKHPAMGKHHQQQAAPILSLHTFCYFLFAVTSISFVPFLYMAYKPCRAEDFVRGSREVDPSLWSGHLDSLPFAWNHLHFSTYPSPRRLTIALFVKRWPKGDRAGGMERHALTLHQALARRGHVTHVFTPHPGGLAPPPPTNMVYHFSEPNPGGGFNARLAWEQFAAADAHHPFDVVHSESVALPHALARNLSNVAVSWHGIAYEVVHSDIVQDLVRPPGEPRTKEQQRRMEERLFRVVEEVKFFDSYAHHVATSDHVGDILRRIYMIPPERVHVILNGVDEKIFNQEAERGLAFRRKHGVPESAKLVVGMSGRLVKDKGHPIMVEALRQVLDEDPGAMDGVFFLVAGDGPWGDRYRDLGPNFLVLGPLDRPALSDFYNALDVFAHPTLRAQGLDQTVLEAMISGKPIMVARFASITESAVVSPEMGYVFSPKVGQLKQALYRVIRDGKEVLEKKGSVAKQRALKLFTATKMAAAFERLFLCISAKNKGEGKDYCSYPLASD
uniref:Putative glycosyltransferase MJ1607 n=1 Tax=Anthurium amnicola TaxID=1678845 RepID=A0A1D1ZFD0_9ARAE